MSTKNLTPLARLFKSRLRKEITLIIVLKLLALSLLWGLFFAHPASSSLKQNVFVHHFLAT